MTRNTSSSYFSHLFITAVGVFIAAFSLSVSAQTPTPVAAADNYYAAGNHIDITAPMPRDVIVAGRQIEIRQPVAGDIVAVGWRVDLSAPAQDDVRIAAAEVKLNAPVTGDVTIAAGDVTLGPNAHISGRSWITGNLIRIDGVIERELRMAGATIEVAGEIRQPVEIVAEKLVILPGAKILAPLTYKSPTEANVASGAVVTGPVTFTRIAETEARRAHAFPTASTLLFSFHLFFAGLLVIFFLPRIETSVMATFKSQPGRSLLIGFVALVTTPVAAAMLIVSLVGLPLGLTLAAVYATALFAAALATAFFVGDLEAKLLAVAPGSGRRQQVVWLFVGVLTLAVLRAVLGGFVVFASVLFGLGALTLTAYHAYQHGQVQAAR